MQNDFLIIASQENIFLFQISVHVAQVSIFSVVSDDLSTKPTINTNQRGLFALIFLSVKKRNAVYHNSYGLFCSRNAKRLRKNMEKKEQKYQKLFAELAEYERAGIRMEIDGIPASPLQIVSAHMVREESGYMRDYVAGDDGIVRELNFYHIKT